MNIVILKKGTAVEVKDAKTLEDAKVIALIALREGYTAEYYQKHSDLTIEKVTVTKAEIIPE